MKNKHLNPAQYVIEVLGGVNATARILDRSPAAVSRWTSRKLINNKRGAIPTSMRPTILKYAQKKKLPIDSHDLDFGRTV